MLIYAELGEQNNNRNIQYAHNAQKEVTNMTKKGIMLVEEVGYKPVVKKKKAGEKTDVNKKKEKK